MQSVAIINGSKKYDGTLIATNEYSKVLGDNGFETHWYQCADTPNAEDYVEGGVMIKGFSMPSETLSVGLNRLFVFHRKLQNLKEDIIFLADPTLIKISDRNRNVVVKVHDFLPLTKYRPKYTGYLMSKFWISRLTNVRRIIVTTEHMKGLVGSLGIDPERIFVVPEPTDFRPDPGHIERSLERISTKGEINLLYIATDKPYKNLDFFIRLSRMFSGTNYRFRFHLVSKLKHVTRKRISEMRPDNLFVYERVEDLGKILDQSDVLLYPSLFEGFGRPLLEAMRFGIPVIANDIQPFREIVGDLGIRENVNNFQKWVDHIVNLTDPETYRRYAELSYRGSIKYSNENFRDSLLNAFDGIS